MGWDGMEGRAPTKAGMDSPCPVHSAWDTHTGDSNDAASYGHPPAQGKGRQRPAQGAGRAIGRAHHAAANPRDTPTHRLAR